MEDFFRGIKQSRHAVAQVDLGSLHRGFYNRKELRGALKARLYVLFFKFK